MVINSSQMSSSHAAIIDRWQAALVWWWRTLLSMLPRSMIKAFCVADPSQLLLRVVDGKLRCVLSDAKGQMCLEEIPFTSDSLVNHDWSVLTGNPKVSRLPMVWLLDAQQILSQTLVLPLEAEDNLDQLFAFDMDRLTPMPVEAVYYGYQIIQRDKASGKVQVLLHVVQREMLDGLLTQLAPTGLSLHGVDIARKVGKGVFCGQGVNLLPVARRQRLPQRTLWWSLFITLAAVLMIGFVQSISVQLKQARMSEWEQQLAILSQTTDSVVELREQVNEAEQATRFIREKKQGTQSASSVLHRLTEILPNHTHVHQLYIKNNQVELHGLSTSAASLIPLLEKTPWFHDVVLRAPISQDKATQKEQYKIRVNSDVEALNSYPSSTVAEQDDSAITDKNTKGEEAG